MNEKRIAKIKSPARKRWLRLQWRNRIEIFLRSPKKNRGALRVWLSPVFIKPLPAPAINIEMLDNPHVPLSLKVEKVNNMLRRRFILNKKPDYESALSVDDCKKNGLFVDDENIDDFVDERPDAQK